MASSTDHVQALVHDRNGIWALITWHKDRVEIEQEDGQEYTVFWNELGLEHFAEPPQIIEDEYTTRADRVLRLIYRMWPPLDRRELNNAVLAQEALVADLASKKQEAPSRSISRRFQKANAQLQELSEQFSQQYRRLPVPRRAIAEPALALEEVA